MEGERVEEEGRRGDRRKEEEREEEKRGRKERRQDRKREGRRGEGKEKWRGGTMGKGGQQYVRMSKRQPHSQKHNPENKANRQEIRLPCTNRQIQPPDIIYTLMSM